MVRGRTGPLLTPRPPYCRDESSVFPIADFTELQVIISSVIDTKCPATCDLAHVKEFAKSLVPRLKRMIAALNKKKWVVTAMVPIVC